MYTLSLDPAYGYVLLVVFLSYILSFFQGFMVGRMRTKLKVEYPAMYSDTEPLFNCYQVNRANKECFLSYDWLPNVHGAILESSPEHAWENASFSYHAYYVP